MEVLHVRLIPDNVRHMLSTVVPPDVEALVDDAAARVAKIDENYPMYTEIYRQERDLVTGEVQTYPMAQLLERSAEAEQLTLEERDARLTIPASGSPEHTSAP